MKENFKIKIGEEFKPSTKLKKIYRIYLLSLIIIGVLSWYIPFMIFVPLLEVKIGISIPLWLIIIFIIYWVEKLYESISYKLTEDEIIMKRGVWFKKKSIVPYLKITNIDITQGPLLRKFGLANIHIQTAGYSGYSHSYTGAEIKLVGIEEFEKLEELIMEFVKKKQQIIKKTSERE
ncbi:MAG: PH domain-containing protein [candidate division WOR-3 bacterium]